MTSRALRVFLFASLLLNVFLVGGIAGGAYRWFAAARPAAVAQAAPHALRFAAQDLSVERQQQFRHMLRQTRVAARPFSRSARDGRIEVARLLGATPFDRAALEAALAQTRAADIEVRAQLESGIVGFAATLTPAERLKLADGLLRWGSFRLPPAARARQRLRNDQAMTKQ